MKNSYGLWFAIVVILSDDGLPKKRNSLIHEICEIQSLSRNPLSN